MDTENIADNVYEMTENTEPSIVLEALVMTIMGTVGRCADPHRALLGVIAEMTDLIRFMEVPKDAPRKEALCHDHWVEDTWEAAQPAEPETEDEAEDEDGGRLPAVTEGATAKVEAARSDQHFTEPPPRYSEASLVKKLEELGIGRPSTYAAILSVLQDRNYVRLEKRRFIPEDRGRLVTAFLVSFFEHYVDTGFTAAMEEKLDDIAGGHVEWRAMLRDFWAEFSDAVDQTKDLKISDVISALDEELGPHFFPAREDGSDPRACPACANGRLGLKLGRYGSFIGCSNYPNCQYTRRLAIESGEDSSATWPARMSW